MDGADDRGPHRLDLVCTISDFVAELERLRRRAAVGSGLKRIGLDRLSRTSGIPQSSLHEYLAGTSLPPADRLDALVLALGATRGEARAWAAALDRLDDVARALRAVPDGKHPALPLRPYDIGRARFPSLSELPIPPGLEHLRGSEEGTTVVLAAVVCNTSTATTVHAEPDVASQGVGYLSAGNSWFLWQAHGGPNPAHSGREAGDLWLFTQGDVAENVDGGWGWVPMNVVTNASVGDPLSGLPVVDRPRKSG